MERLEPEGWAPDRQPWDRQPGESKVAHEAFHVYIRYPYGDYSGGIGLGRSTAKVGQQLGKSKTQIDRWCSRWGWVARAEQYDLELARIEFQERTKAHALWIRQAEKNLRGVRDDAHRLYGVLMERVLEMLQSPLYIEVDEEGVNEEGVQVVYRKVIPADWSFRTIPSMIRAMVEMAQITTHTGGNWDAVLKLVDYDALTDEQLEAISTATTPEEIISAIIRAGTA